MAASYLLDSNILIAAIKGEPRALLNRLAGMAANRLCLSSLVLAELSVGAEKGPGATRRHADIADLTAGMTPQSSGHPSVIRLGVQLPLLPASIGIEVL